MLSDTVFYGLMEALYQMYAVDKITFAEYLDVETELGNARAKAKGYL